MKTVNTDILSFKMIGIAKIVLTTNSHNLLSY